MITISSWWLLDQWRNRRMVRFWWSPSILVGRFLVISDGALCCRMLDVDRIGESVDESFDGEILKSVDFERSSLPLGRGLDGDRTECILFPWRVFIHGWDDVYHQQWIRFRLFPEVLFGVIWMRDGIIQRLFFYWFWVVEMIFPLFLLLIWSGRCHLNQVVERVSTPVVNVDDRRWSINSDSGRHHAWFIWLIVYRLVEALSCSYWGHLLNWWYEYGSGGCFYDVTLEFLLKVWGLENDRMGGFSDICTLWCKEWPCVQWGNDLFLMCNFGHLLIGESI